MQKRSIVYKDISTLIPYIGNSRTHSDGQVKQIAASIQEFGFTNPILIDEENSVIAGHGRIMAAELIEQKQVPCIVLSGLTNAQKKALVIADNQLASNADWDMDKLTLELESLLELDFDIDILGFDDDILENILGQGKTEGLTEEDSIPDIPEIPTNKLGDIWNLGNHKLICGDSTDKASLNILMEVDRADLIFTDPPYGMAYGGGRAKGDNVSFNNRSGGIKAHGPILGDSLQGDSLVSLVKNAISEARNVTKPGAGAYVCFTWRTYAQFEEALRDFDIKGCIVWDKQSIGLGHSHYRPQHEFIFYCNGPWYGGRAESDVWKMSRGATGEYVHPTQKPVELIERALTNSSKRGDIVLDSFGGSGSTLIACEKTGRNARLIELDPKYCDVIIKRWEDFTGQDAIHAETGITYKVSVNG